MPEGDEEYAKGGVLKMYLGEVGDMSRPLFSASDSINFVSKAMVSANQDRLLGRYKRFMPIALAYASLSKDPSTKVGALVLGPDLEERSSGWNGAPRACKADEDERYKSRDTRLRWATHAEANAVANAARAGHSLKGCTMLVTHTPCMSCAKLLVQAGISTVISPTPTGGFAERWKEDYELTRALFTECGVTLIEYDV